MPKDFVAICLFMLGSAAWASEMLYVSASAWSGLTNSEKNQIQERYLVNTLDVSTFGLIIDNQGANRSTAGSDAGSRLGEVTASATYVDRSLDGGNYSAKDHLAMMILGGLIGSAMNTSPQSKYQFRYAVKLANGVISYFDQWSSDPFRHPVGVCVSVPDLRLIADQRVCSQTTSTIRDFYVAADSKAVSSKETHSIFKSEGTTVDQGCRSYAYVVDLTK